MWQLVVKNEHKPFWNQTLHSINEAVMDIRDVFTQMNAPKDILILSAWTKLRAWGSVSEEHGQC